MRGTSGHRREAERFARALEDPAYADSERFAGLLATVALLEAAPPPPTRPEFVAGLRGRLVAEAAVTLGAEPATVRRLTLPGRPVGRGSAWERRLSALVAAAVLAGSAAGVAVAASHSDPGQLLYPVKRGLEQAGLLLQTNDAGRGRDLLGQASTRLQEAGSLLAADASASQIGDSLAAFRSQAEQGSRYLFGDYQRTGNAEDIATVRTFANTQRVQLDRLARDAPAALAGAVREARNMVSALRQQAEVLCAACGGSASTAPLTRATSAHTISSLFVAPAIAAGKDARAEHAARLRQQLRSEAHKAGVQASKTPLPSQPTLTVNSGPTIRTGASKGTTVSSRTLALVTATVHGHEAVTALVDQVTATAGSIADPVTGTVATAIHRVRAGLPTLP